MRLWVVLGIRIPTAIHCFVLGMVWLAAAQNVSALDSKRAISQYARRVWTMENGLPNRPVTSVLQTQDGYLWVGMEGGLARFDGERFTLFTTANTPELAGSLVIGLSEDRQGGLLIATSHGIVRYAQGKFQHYSTANGMPHDKALSFLDLGAEGLVLGTLKGLCRFRAGRMELDPRDQALAGKPIFALAVDARQNLWAAVFGGGLLQLDAQGQATVYTTTQGLASNAVSALLLDSQQRLWVGTAAGLSLIKDGQVQPLSASPPVGYIYGFLEDRDRNIWIAGQKGLWRLTEGDVARSTVYFGHTEKRRDEFYQLREDREGNVWIASNSGLTRFSDGEAICWSVEEGLRDRRVSALLPDHPAGVLVGTDRGLSIIENGQAKPFAPEVPFFRREINNLYADNAGVLWVSTSEGLASWQAGRLQRWGAAQGVNGGIRGLSTGPDGEMLVAMQGLGLTVRAGNRFAPHPLNREIVEKLQTPYLIHAARNGTLWLGGMSGLAAIRDGRATYFLTAQFPMLRDLLSLIEDEEGTLWVGCFNGLVRFRDGQAALVSARHGLLEDKVTFMTLDGKERLWIGCNQGLYAVSLTELRQCADRQAERLNVRRYGLADGLKTVETPNIRAGARRAADGRLYFATLDGVAMIDPHAPPRTVSPPPVFIERVRADERELSLKPPFQTVIQTMLTVPPDTRRLYFDYTALSYRNPEAVRFRYRLEGFDRNWMEVGDQRETYYTLLPPGDYTFRVQAAVRNGGWSADGAQLRFTLMPHFYQTWWFLALCVAGAGAILWTAYRLRLTQVEARYQAVLLERTRMAEELHDTFSHTFTGVIMQLEATNSLFSKQKGNPQFHLARAMRMAREGLTEARRAVYALQPGALEAKPLPEALAGLLAETEAEGGVQMTLTVSGEPRLIPAAVALHAFRIVQEAITNAQRHAAAKLISVDLQLAADGLRLWVADDGRGFDPQAQTPAGYGLIGMRERAHRIGGTLTVESRLGQGTKITLAVAFSTGVSA